MCKMSKMTIPSSRSLILWISVFSITSPLADFGLLRESSEMIMSSSKIPALPGLKSHTYISEKVGRYIKITNFSRLHCLAIPRRDLSTKKTKPNIEKWPENLGSYVTILIYRTWASIIQGSGIGRRYFANFYFIQCFSKKEWTLEAVVTKSTFRLSNV